MISYLFLFFSLLIFLYPNREKSNNYSLYSILFGAFNLAHFLLGFISLLLIHTGNSKFPILIITTFREIVFEVEIFFIFSHNVYSTTGIDLIFIFSKKKLNLKKISYKKYFNF